MLSVQYDENKTQMGVEWWGKQHATLLYAPDICQNAASHACMHAWACLMHGPIVMIACR